MREGNRNVTVVDDDAGVRRALTRLLRAAGYTPVTYESAEALLENHGEEKAACLVLDIHLGGMSGLDLGRKLAAGGSRVPVIFITAHDDDWCREASREAGSLGLLRKPFDGQSFLNIVGRAFQPAAGAP